MATSETERMYQPGGEGRSHDERHSWLYYTLRSPYFWVTIGVLLFSAATGVLVWKQNPAYTLIVSALPLVLLGMYRAQQRLFLAPVIIMFTAAFTNYYIATGTMSTIVDSFALTMVFVGVWVLRSFVVNKRFTLVPYSTNLPLFGFLITVLIALLWSFGFRDPFVSTWNTFAFVQIATALVMIMLPAILLLIGNTVTDIRVIKTIVVLMLVAGVVGYAWDQHWINYEIKTRGLFTMWVICLSVGLAIFNKRLPAIARGLLLFLAAVWLYYRFGIKISWLSGWLPSFVVLFTLTYLRSKKLSLLVIALLVIVILSSPEYYERAFSAEQSESGYTRLDAWSTNWKITSKHFLFGTGPGGYVAYLQTYYPDDAVATHSNYIDILAETGVVGLFFYGWFFVKLLLLGYTVSKRVKGRGDFIEAIANVSFAGTVGSVMAMFFGDWVIPFPYTQSISAFDYISYSWIFMGFILVLDRMTREKMIPDLQSGGAGLNVEGNPNASLNYRNER